LALTVSGTPGKTPPHLFEQPYRFHDAIKADRGCGGTFPDIRGEVLIGGRVDAESGANQIADRFGLKLTNVVRKLLSVWPPPTIRRAQMATIQMRELVNERSISGFGRNSEMTRCANRRHPSRFLAAEEAAN
jgi:hypothetical protein